MNTAIPLYGPPAASWTNVVSPNTALAMTPFSTTGAPGLSSGSGVM